MVVFPVLPEVEPAVGETDLGVLEAERELTQYFQTTALQNSLRYLAPAHSNSPVKVASPAREDFAKVLAAKLLALGEQLLRQDAEFRELRRSATSVPPEVNVLREENAMLAARNQQAFEEAAELSARHGALECEREAAKREVEAAEEDMDALASKVSAARTSEAEASGEQESASRALDLERKRGQDLAQALSQALHQRQRVADEAEHRAVAAEREKFNLEATTSAARAEANTSASVAEADSQKTKATLQRLEAQLAEKAGRQQSEAQQVATARGELAQVETEAAGLEDAAEELARKLAESEEKAEETERKAMAVAQELMETSKSIARLRGEVLAGQSQNLRQSLEAAQREAGELDQRSRALGVPSPAGPLQGPREAEGRALNGALRSAWEHEAKERRKTEQQLEAAEATWLQVCEMLQSLTLVARRCRQEMIASGVAPTALPLPPDDAAWEESRVSSSLKALGLVFEALCRECGKGCPVAPASRAARLGPPLRGRRA